jgi:hypothetical protein
MSILPPSPSTRKMRAPEVKSSGALVSSEAMWAVGWAKIAPHGGVQQESARPFAAVPVSTGKATRSGLSKISRRRRSTRWVHSSAP